MQRVFFYPGQGSQYPGMGLDISRKSPSVRNLFSMASEIGGFDVPKILEHGSLEVLQRTDYSQLLITVVSLAAHTFLKEREITSEAAVGFSLGEYAAMVDAGVLTGEDALSTVRQRGEVMETISRTLDSQENKAGMLAVIGLYADQVAEAIKGIPDAYCTIYNSPRQTVVSATAEALPQVTQSLQTAGAKRIIRLHVSGPFHCPLMKEAATEFKCYLDAVPFADPQKVIYSNVTGTQAHKGSELKELCSQQLISPVQWTKTEQAVAQDGGTDLYEVGPGKVLKGLWKSFASSHELQNLEILPAGTVAEIIKLGV